MREAVSGEGAPARRIGWNPAVLPIVLLLAVGLALRFIIAYVLVPGSGFPNDIASFQSWANTIAADLAAGHLPLGFYDSPGFHDYPPAYMIVLGLFGLPFRPLGGVGDAIKLLPMLADTVLAGVVWVMAQELGASRRWATVAAVVIVVNPIVWFDSAVWGQADSVGTIVLLLGLRELLKDHREAAAALAVLAGLTKPQLGILAIVVGFVVLRRSLLPPPGERRQPSRILTSLGAGFATAIVVSFPFVGLRLDTIVRQLFQTFGEYPYLTLNAYNPWALVSWGADSIANNRAWIPDSSFVDPTGAVIRGMHFAPPPAVAAGGSFLVVVAFALTVWLAWRSGRRWLAPAAGVAAGLPAVAVLIALTGVPFGPLPMALIGDGLLVAAILVVALWAAWRDDALSIVVALAILTIAFFVVPTRAHERYLYPFFGLGAILLALSWRWALAYVVLAAVNFLNLYAVLVQYDGLHVAGQPADPAGLGGYLLSWGPITAIGLTTGLGFAWALAQLRPAASLALEAEAEAAAGAPAFAGIWSRLLGPEPPALPAATVRPRTGIAASPALSLGAVHGPNDGREAILEAGFDGELEEHDGLEEFGEPDEGEPQPERSRLRRLADRVGAPALRPDRTSSLAFEPPGRLDRLDLWLVVVLVVACLALRTFRLGEPLGMHFDEVYHARTATEFLQDWRYGIQHDIYEWTHPHLAKYVIAGGLVTFSDDKVTATAQLGGSTRDAAIEPRWDNGNADQRVGDRLYVATGDLLRVYDLATRALIEEKTVPGASAVSVDQGAHKVYVGTADGAVYVLPTAPLDELRGGGRVSDAERTPQRLTEAVGFPIARIYAAADATNQARHPTSSGQVTAAQVVLATDGHGRIVSLDASSGARLGSGSVAGAADFATIDSSNGVAAVAGQVKDAAGEAAALAGAINSAAAGGSSQPVSAASLQADLAATGAPGAELPLRLPSLSAAQMTAVQHLIDDGTLAGVRQTAVPRVAVAGSAGLVVVDGRSVTTQTTLPIVGGATSIALGSADSDNGVDFVHIYAASGRQLTIARLNNGLAGQPAALVADRTLQMPGSIERVAFDPSNQILQALGRTADGSASTVYAVETHGNAVFSDARLPFQPVAWAADVAPAYPSADRQALDLFAADGTMASVDVGQFSFAWRFPGVVFGALMAGALYLLVRVLFRRRTVGLLVALFALVDGMFFVQSRIAMNDTYVGFFVVAAYLVFALVWTGIWKGRWAFWLAMPLTGVCLGLGLASKWVAFYVIASMAMLVLLRSALGRALIVAAMAAGTGILGWLALNETPAMTAGSGSTAAFVGLVGVAALVAVTGAAWALQAASSGDRAVIGTGTVLVAGLIGLAGLSQSPLPVANGGPNYTFFLIMLAATLVAAAVNAYRPVRWTVEEVYFAVGAPAVAGIGISALAVLAGPKSSSLLLAGGALVVAAMAVAVLFWVVGRWGFGPLAIPPDPDDPSALADPPTPAPTGWLRLGWGFGLPVVWMVVCLVALPIAIYIVSYVPWALINNDVLFDKMPIVGTWPAGHTGQTLIDLTQQMYNYHNDLRSPHPASSPWWAWPMDLKPVWFFNSDYAANTGAQIYDGGNLALWWLAIPAMAFACWQAFKRRSLGLTLITLAFFWQWLSWSRIDRASFQYHFYTALPFFLAALAYLVAELWHGPSARTWLMARLAAGLAILGAPLLWLLKYPLCGLARVDVTPGSYQATACGATQGDLTVETRIGLIAVILLVALVILLVEFVRLERRQRRGAPESGRWLVELIAPVAIAGALLWWVGQNAPRGVLFSVAVPAELLGLLALLLLMLLAAVALTARDPRRFALGIAGVGVVVFVAIYPNIAALPMPGPLVSIYQGLLPTWLYGFQFGVNQQQAAQVKLLDPSAIVLGAGVLVTAAVVGYAAWFRRVSEGYRRRRRLDMDEAELPEGV